MRGSSPRMTLSVRAFENKKCVTLRHCCLSQSSTGNANAADPDNDGDTSNNETVINIQITVSSGSDNKVDIQA
jgi:hypothetical protein